MELKSGSSFTSFNSQHMFVEGCTSMLQAGFTLRFRAVGGSMAPTIREGETIVVMPVNPAEIQRGDVVLYRKHEKVIVHRVEAIEGAQFTLRGDALDFCDQVVKAYQVYGKAVWVERGGRRIALDSRWAKILWTVRCHAALFIQWVKQGSGTPTLAS